MSETYVITFQVRPDQRERFRALLDPVLDAMRHEATFEGASLHVDPDDENRFQLHETWKDRQDVLEVQLTRPYRLNGTLPLTRSLSGHARSGHGRCCVQTDGASVDARYNYLRILSPPFPDRPAHQNGNEKAEAAERHDIDSRDQFAGAVLAGSEQACVSEDHANGHGGRETEEQDRGDQHDASEGDQQTSGSQGILLLRSRGYRQTCRGRLAVGDRVSGDVSA